MNTMSPLLEVKDPPLIFRLHFWRILRPETRAQTVETNTTLISRLRPSAQHEGPRALDGDDDLQALFVRVGGELVSLQPETNDELLEFLQGGAVSLEYWNIIIFGLELVLPQRQERD